MLARSSIRQINYIDSYLFESQQFDSNEFDSIHKLAEGHDSQTIYSDTEVSTLIGHCSGTVTGVSGKR